MNGIAARVACRGLVALLPAFGLASGCSKPAAPGATAPVRVFAAASLAAVFPVLARAFEQQHGATVELHFAGSPQLGMQLREGAAADVFASADDANMQKVLDAGMAATPRAFAQNHLAIVVSLGNPKHVRGLADLARGELTVAACGPAVPVGQYARQMLARQGLAVAFVSDEPNVKAVVAKVQLGEVDAGIVYATDLRVPGVEAIPIPSAQNVVASYPIAALDRGGNRVGGEAFVAFVCSAAGRAILAEHGFALP